MYELFWCSLQTTSSNHFAVTTGQQQGAKKVELLLDEVLEKLDRMDREGATEGQTLDELIEQLGAGTQSEVVQAQLKLLLEDREKSKRARALKKQLSERAKVLERLEAQVRGSATLSLRFCIE